MQIGLESRITRAPFATLLRVFQFIAAAFVVFLAMASYCPAATERAAAAHVGVERGLQFLQKEAFRWKSTKSCAACHHAASMLWTFNEARAHGYSVDEQALKEIRAWAFADMQTNSLTDQAPPRDVLNLGWVYVLLSAETVPGFNSPSASNRQDPPATDKAGASTGDAILSARQTLLHQITVKQTADGSWGRPLDERVPLGGPVEDIAVLARLALLQSGDKSTLVTDCINKAERWLAANRDKPSRQGRNLRLLMNVFEGKPAAELAPAIAAIRAEQNADGGWSQTPDMTSDAYATGQTLYVLARAGVKKEAPEMTRGVEFLTHTQREDGSWPMTSRVHAKDLSPITGAGTAWAVLGLIRSEI
jgi:hypothetical protein